MNACAARWGFKDPQGIEVQQCACACCRIQCDRDKGCPTDCAEPENLEVTSLKDAGEASALHADASNGGSEASATNALTLVLGGCALAAVVVAWAVRVKRARATSELI
jgi:hypothetical protein